MRILVIGSSGTIGSAVIRALAPSVEAVIGVSRTGQGAVRGETTHLKADRGDAASIADAIRENRIDRVVDMAAYTPDESAALLAQIEPRVDRYVLASSSDVYRNYGLLQDLETGEPTTGLIDETAPLRASRYPYRRNTARSASDPQRWMDDYDKIPIEQSVRALACDWAILRLPMVFGPGDRQHRFAWAIAPMKAGADRIVAPKSWIDWVTTYGFVENVGAMIAAAAVDPRPTCDVFNIGDFPPVAHRIWVERIADQLDWRGRIIATDRDTPLSAAISGLDLSVPLALSFDKFRGQFGDVATVSIDDALGHTVGDFRAG